MTGRSGHLSLWNLFWSSSGVVRAVMLGLIAASVYSWALIFITGRHFYDLEKRSRRFERGFWSGESLESFYNRLSSLPHDPFQAMFLAGMREWKWLMASSFTPLDPEALGRRTQKTMMAVIEKELPPLQQRFGFLASLGSTAPFVGLFGTVWGIMHSFQEISVSQNTSLATVAPAIAEALLATGIGLFAAIPAVAAYNFFVTYIENYSHRLETFSTEFVSLMVHQAEDVKQRGLSQDA